MHQLHNNYDKVVGSLSSFKSLVKYDNILQDVFLHGKSAYLLGDKINAKVEFLERRFESITKIPFGADFESSEDIDHTIFRSRIADVNEICRTFCDTLFYINKYELLDFMNSNYNSIAKLNKIKLVIELNDGIKFKFLPFKKSTSVFPCEYKVDTSTRICPNFRIEFGEISVSALLVHQALNNELLNKNVKIEINTRKGFLRASCIDGSVKSKFTIGKIEE